MPSSGTSSFWLRQPQKSSLRDGVRQNDGNCSRRCAQRSSIQGVVRSRLPRARHVQQPFLHAARSVAAILRTHSNFVAVRGSTTNIHPRSLILASAAC
eukprot:4262478-Pleurochrysis_carterae.AAC.2